VTGVLPTLTRWGVDLALVRPILQAIATVVLLDTHVLDDRVWAEIEAVIALALVYRSARARRQLAFFLRLVQVLPIVRYGRPFTALPSRRRRAVLDRLSRSRLVMIRRGFSGIRTLLFMGYYTRADVAESIGYRATAAGWEARGGTAATVPLAPVLWVER
jgi:hypothetical protein